jgi:pilus assembly protein CpaE
MVSERMRTTRHRTRIVALTDDPAFEQAAAAALGKPAGFDLTFVLDPTRKYDDSVLAQADVVLIDVSPGLQDTAYKLAVAAGRTERKPPVVAVTDRFDAGMARRFLQLRISDFLLKPVAADELVRACTLAARSAPEPASADAEIIAFLPASGGVGVTTLAIETALLLNRSGRRGNGSTCLVDLDFQHGTCADHLDIEPRLDLNEIEPQPERLDGQLLEVMLSQHPSGLSVICAPNRPAEMRSFDPDVVTRLLDLASVRFDHVVLDLPRTWFAWTDTILLGSDKAFVVAEATVPGLRHANALVAAIRQRLGDGAQPRVIVNRFEQRMFSGGIKRADIEQALGEAFAGSVPNNYRLVREAIDRGVPLSEVKAGNEISTELKKIVIPPPQSKERRSPLALAGARLGLFQAG